MQQRDPLLTRTTIGMALVLLAVNVLVCRELFFIEYTKYLGSIEAAYIGISRYNLDHPFAWDWFPLWYGGVPYHNTYNPLLHLLVAASAWLTGASPALSHHAVTAAFYALGPVTLFAMLLALSRRPYPSFLAALFYSLFSPAPLLVENIRAWAETPLWPTRLQALLEFGDGPHMAAVTLLPLAILALHVALEKRRALPTVLAAVAFASVVLTNWLGAFALAIMTAAYLLVRSGEADRLRLLGWSALTGAMAYGLALPWIPPSSIADVRHNAQQVGGRFPMTAKHLLYAACVVAAVALLWRLYRRFKPSLVVAYSGLLTFLFATMVLADDLLGIHLMPQPHRYHHEMELAICVFVVFGLAQLARPLFQTSRARWIGAAAALVFTVVQYGNYRVKARDILEPIDITETVEYQISTWLRDNIPDDRVFISGATQFWLLAFSDTPQLDGGYAQGIVNRHIPVVNYGIPYTVGDGEKTAMWLRLFGVKAVVVNGPAGRDFYREAWRDGTKFDGVLPELWRNGGDAIFAIPQRSSSLASVILPEHAPIRAPFNNDDTAAVEGLAAAMEDPALPLAELAWADQSTAVISADLEPDHLLYVQISHHPGWRAYVNGEPRRIRKNVLGLMTLEPRCEGPCAVTLVFDGGLEMSLARLICGLTVLGGLLWLAAARPPGDDG